MLYLVATPIGNLGDFSYRAVEVLNSCDYILCEDTRHSLTLFKHYNVKKPLKSFHQFNELKMEDAVVQDLREGKTIGLVTDAGTPGISDPGYALTQRLFQEQLPWTLIPGPCALIQALVCSGFDSHHFQFVGFLPRPEQQKRKTLQSILQFPGTTICYESPHRISDTLKVLQGLDPTRELAIARELTKKFEEILRGTAEQLLNIPIKGETILLIKGRSAEPRQEWESLTIEEHVHMLIQDYGLTKQEAVKTAAEMRGLPKRSVYNQIHRKNSE